MTATSQLVTVDAADFNRAAAALEGAGFDELAGKIVKHALRRSANVVRDNVRTRAARHGQRLAKGVHTTWRGAGFAFQLRVSATGPVAHLIAGGVKPHRIAPGRVMKIGGVIGFARAVQHPGFRADPFVHRGIVDSLPAIQAIVDQAGSEMAAALAARLKRG